MVELAGDDGDERRRGSRPARRKRHVRPRWSDGLKFRNTLKIQRTSTFRAEFQRKVN